MLSSAAAAGWTMYAPPPDDPARDPLHELWLEDPGGNLVEVYARLTDAELAENGHSR